MESAGRSEKLPLTILTDVQKYLQWSAGYREVALPIIILTAIGALFFTIGFEDIQVAIKIKVEVKVTVKLGLRSSV